MAVGRSAALGSARLPRDRLRRAGQRPSRLRLLRPQRRREFAQRGAGDLQVLRRLGKPRRLDAAVGADPGDLRRAGRGVRPIVAAHAQGQRARRAGPDQRRLPAVHPSDLEPVRAPVARPVRGARPQPDPSGPGPRDPSADPLPRLCRLLDRLFLRRRRPDRGPDRRGLGAVRPAVRPRRLGLSDDRHRRRLVLGLLHARLGRLLVLGSGRERFAHAVAGRAPPSSIRSR